jgi:dipeptidyl aminopeptidase/acylaminoacyl peptidase
MLLLALLVAQTPPAPLTLQPLWGSKDVVASHIPPLPKALEARVHQYAEVRSAVLRDVSEDGRTLLISTRFGSSEQLHRVSQPLGTREQLTFFDAPPGQAALLPGDPNTLFFLEGPTQGEASQLLRLDLRTGRTEVLTDGRSRHAAFVLSKEGRWVAYSGTGRNGQDSDIYLAEVADAHRARRLTELEGSWLPLEFSPDGQKLLLLQRHGEEAEAVWVLDVATLARRQLLPRPGAADGSRVRQALFSADGKGVYLVTDASTAAATLCLVLLAQPDGPAKPVLAQLPGEAERVAVARDGTLVFTTNEAGTSRTYRLLDGRAERLPLPEGVVHGLRFARDRSDVLFFGLESATSPLDVWALSLKTNRLTRWTQSEVGGLDARGFVAPEVVHYQAEDGLALSAWLYRPRLVPPGAKVPVVVSFHDGPAGQARPVFRPEVQLLLEEGFAVLAPNVRGSDGQGKAFRAADDGVRREGVLLDVAATVGFIAHQQGLDASAVAAFGQGYGGYLALAAGAFFPGAFRAVVDVSGMPHLPTFLETAPAYRRDALRAEYGDERLPAVRAVLERISPLNAVGRMQAALLVVEGKKDARVPLGQAEALVRARSADGWYLLALDEGRGVWRRQTQEIATLATVLFLEEYLKGSAPKATP